MMEQGAAHAAFVGAEFTIVTPQHMHRTDQPVVVRDVQLQRGTISHDLRAADQRNVIEDQHIEIAAIEDLENTAPVNQRPAKLMGDDWCERAKSAPQSDGLHTVVLRHRNGMLAARVHYVECVDVVDHRHMVPAFDQRARHALSRDSIATKVVRRIKGGYETEPQSMHWMKPSSSPLLV